MFAELHKAISYLYAECCIHPSSVSLMIPGKQVDYVTCYMSLCVICQLFLEPYFLKASFGRPSLLAYFCAWQDFSVGSKYHSCQVFQSRSSSEIQNVLSVSKTSHGLQCLLDTQRLAILGLHLRGEKHLWFTLSLGRSHPSIDGAAG